MRALPGVCLALQLAAWGGAAPHPAPVRSAAPLPAFPGAEGAGRFATGGRGGTIVRVTNLNASGPGSLADAVSAPNRIVVFVVSGIIDLARGGQGGRIEVAHPNITIAGQSAPGEGVCLRGGALNIKASNVILRHLRSRRGFVAEGDMGDSLAVKPAAAGEQTTATGRTAEEFEKIRIKKIERGRQVSAFIDLENILIDHCSASWATDENLTVTHAGHSTISYCIAAEGLDYANPRQTPPNHSEGGLWGSAAPDGRSSMHHMLFAHNRLRNPRTTAGADIPPVLTLYNSVVYNWSEYATHTGSQRVYLQWLANYYLPGPDTPAGVRHVGFQFHGDPGARVYAQGNIMADSPAATADNRLAVGHNRKFKDTPPDQKAAMIVDAPFTALPAKLQTADEALATVLAEAGATLPARDAVDRRIIESVRTRTGRVIGKETDLSESERWPDYRSLPPLPDADADGMPDYWEKQFGFDPHEAVDAAALTASGYAAIEHYLNNTDPRATATAQAGDKAIVMVAATVSRAHAGTRTAGAWRFTRTGAATSPLRVRYRVSGDAVPGRDFVPLAGTVTIPAGAASATLALEPLDSARDNCTVVVTLEAGQDAWFVGCPAQSLIVIRR